MIQFHKYQNLKNISLLLLDQQITLAQINQDLDIMTTKFKIIIRN